MTIGKKIKYIRKLYHMSSAELAELSGIHPVSIRKYETDKMIPQQAQINRIAAAFQVSPVVFSDVNETKYDFQFSGDVLFLIITLYLSGGLIVSGNRSDDGALTPNSVKFSLTPLFDKFLRFYHSNEEIELKQLSLGIIDENTLKHFIYWEYMYNRKDEYYEACLAEESQEKLDQYNQVQDDYDEVEINTLLSGRRNLITDKE